MILYVPECVHCACTTCTQVPQRPEDGKRSTEVELLEVVSCLMWVLGVKPGSWDLNWRPLDKQQMFLTTKPSLLPCALETPRVYNSSTEAAFTSASIPGYTAVCADRNLGEPLCMHENFPVTCFFLQLSRLSCIGCFQRPFKIFLNWFLEILDQLMYSSVLHSTHPI